MTGLQKPDKLNNSGAQQPPAQTQAQVQTSGNRFVNDLISTSSKQLLNAYVYDFLIKSSLPQTASTFIKEADVPTDMNINAPLQIRKPPQKDLLPLAISKDAPQGFLYEWWQIFWDVFNARTHRGGSENAQHYYHLQLLRQRKEHALHSSTFYAAHEQAHSMSMANNAYNQQLLMQQQQQQHHQQQQQQQQQQLQLQLQLQQQQLLHQQQQQLPQELQSQPHSSDDSHVNTPHGQHTPTAGQVTQIPLQNQPQRIPQGPQLQRQPQQFPQQGMMNGSLMQPQASPLQQQQAGATPTPNFNQYNQLQHPIENSQSQPLQKSQQQQEVQQNFQQQQSQLFAGKNRGQMSVGGPNAAQPNYQNMIRAQYQHLNQQQVQAQAAQIQQQQLQQYKAMQLHHQQQLDINMSNGSHGFPQAPTAGSPSTINTQPKPTKSFKKPKLEDINDHVSPLSVSPQAIGTLNNGVAKIEGHTPTNSSPLANVVKPGVDQNDFSNNGKPHPTGSSALQDYQMQLMLLERENKRILNGSSKKKDKSPANKNMPPPKNLKTNTPMSSPAIGSKNVTTNVTVGRKKKETQPRKNAKKNANITANTSEPPTPTTPITPSTTVASKTSNNNHNSRKEHNDPTTVSHNKKDNNNVDLPKDSSGGTSQLTPPNSENTANSAGNTGADQGNNGPGDDTKINDPSLLQDDLSGPNMLNNDHHISNDLYTDFPLSDFSNELPGDENFNLESFINTDGADLGNFESYWHDSVEATE